MSFSNKKLKGSLPVNMPTGKSGIWTVDEISNIKREQSSVQFGTQPNQFYENWERDPDSDPYYNNVIWHLSDAPETGNSLYDHSGKNHDVHVIKNRNDWPFGTYFHDSPQQNHSTYFHDSSYTVNDAATLRLGTSSFTIEFWANLHRQDATEHYIMGKGGNAGRTSGTGWVVYLTTTYNIGFYDAVSNVSVQTSIALNRDQWYHIAIVRENTSTNGLKIYVDGALAATGTSSGNFTDTNAMYIGRDRVNTAASAYYGKLTDISIKGEAVYSNAFTRPTTSISDLAPPALLTIGAREPWHPNSPLWQKEGLTITVNSNAVSRTMDNPFLIKSYNTYLIGGNHSVFMLNGQWFRIKDYSAGGANYLNFGTGAFTVEAWIRVPDNVIYTGICGKGTGNVGAVGSTGWSAYIDTSGNPAWSDGANTLNGTNTTHRISQHGWYHIAYVRTSTSANGFKIYINGKTAYTGTVATNYTNTNDLYMFASRDAQYVSTGTAMCYLRISKTARYNAEFSVTDVGGFMNNMRTSDANTSLMTLGVYGAPYENPIDGGWVNEGYAQHNFRPKYEHLMMGDRYISSRVAPSADFGGHSHWFYSSQNRVLARTSTNDFSFGTGDFSLEFWWRSMHTTGETGTHVFFDTRQWWNDSGISLTSTHLTGFEVQTGNQVVLTTDKGAYNKSARWMHICIQRANGVIALYLNGKKETENKYTGSIDSPQNRIVIGNGGYPNLRYASGIYGHLSNFRIVKGVGAYANYTSGVGSNPNAFAVPTKPLEVTANTVFLSLCGPTIKDYSGRNQVASGGFQDLQENITSAWDTWPSNLSPFNPTTSFNHNEVFGGDQHASTGSGFYSMYPEHYYNGSRAPTLGWIPRMSRAWTIECWFWAHETNPGAPGNIELFRTAAGANQNGWQLWYHINSGLANSRLDVAFRMWRGTVGEANFGSTGNTGNIIPHCWNHIAVQYDPTKTNKMAIFTNGKRVATAAAFAGSNYVSITDHMYSINAGMGPIRISDIARFDNDAINVTVPTQRWTYDPNTFICTYPISPILDSSQRAQWYNYGVIPDRTHKKFGLASLKFPNDANNTIHVCRLWSLEGYWSQRVKDVRREDCTIECWASWQDAAAGGKAFATATEGACLFHWGNALWVGISPTGFWQLLIKNANSTTYETNTTTVQVGTTTAGTFDHIAVVRSGKNWLFYVNGVQYTIMKTNNQGTYTNGPTYNHDWDMVTWSEFVLGADNSVLQATKWCGNIQDFRLTTGVARYETRVLNGVATMVHKGTDIPALPIRLHPTK